jgi:internalin A
MNDLERIQEIEKVFGFKLNEVPLDKLDSENEFYSISTFKYFQLSSLKEPTFPHKGTRNYSKDSLGNVIGLSLDYSPVISLPINYILGFENLTHLRLKNVALDDYSFLTKMKELKSLTLSNNSLSEVAFLKEMKSLTSLDLSFNELTDVSFLEELNELTTLDLSSNNLSDVSFLKKIEKLSTLHLRSNYISNISFLEEMQSIKILDLRSNKFSNASFLKRVPNITSLYLSYNKLPDLAFLKDMTNLTSLYISSLGITDISFLENLKGLKSLYLSENKIKDYSPLKQLKEITSIDLSKNNLEDKNISFLKEMDSLVSLNLGDTNVYDISLLKDLQSIKFLYLKNNNLSKSKISFLKEMIGITTLDLRNNGIAKEEISILKELPELTALDLSMNPLINYSILKEMQGLDLLFLRNNKLEDISFLKDLKKLTVLDISYNKISKIAPLKEIIKLTSLDLRKNSIPNISHLKEMKQLTSLDLGRNNLSDISSLKDLRAISYLDLGENEKINYYSSLKELRGLTLLGLEKNKVSDISFLSELKGLKSLDLANNKIIDTLPLKELKSLSSLDLSDNKESKDFSFLVGLENLTSLDLSSCEKINYSILSELHKLTSLGLNKNKIEDTSFLKELKNLISLNLKSNQITDISFLNEFKHLDLVDLSNNKLTILPENITELSLKLVIDGKEEPFEDAINLKGNPIESPPLEFVRQGIDSIKNYFSQIKNNSKMEYFHESKLFLIGTESKSKDLILDALTNRYFALKTENLSAESISIFKWDKPLEKKESDNSGKDVYNTTHQFLISDNSLYLYITKGGNDWNLKDFEIWLELIAKFTGNSSIIFIQIKTNSSEVDIDITTYKELYPNIRLDSYFITTVDNDKLADFQKNIFNIIHERKLFNIVEKIPEIHIKIYQEIKELKENYISLQKFFEICEKYLLNESQALSLSEYFHRKGVFLHFQNEIGLKTIIFLNREWITTALFNLFNNERIKNQFGKFTDDDLKGVWDEKHYYALLPLLKNPRFKICFLDKKGFYLMPQLFSNSKLTIDLQITKGSLAYQYKYEKNPTGIISQLIISMHEKIEDDAYSRGGVLLKDNKAKALVIEDQERKIISIRTVGKQGKDLLIDINKEIRKINKLFGKLDIIESVGCNCMKCQNSEKQHFF